MRLMSARIYGLKGIYSKSGVKEIEIDFTKCIHDIIYIIGKNGSGKSTLMSVLHPFPDSAQMYLDNEPGKKELVYYHEGISYKVTIQYPLNNNSTRGTTKAYIEESKQGQLPVELNSNGTIGSYKDALSAVFCLDPNFISLSHLSVEDRGIVDKRPAERKKFVANILESIEVYNNINKTLVKRSGVFKSMVNSIVAKIDSIGDESKLVMEESAAKARLNVLQNEKLNLEKQISASEAIKNVIDPDDKIQKHYEEMVNRLNILTTQIHAIQIKLPGDITLDSATKEYSDLNTRIAVLNTEESNLFTRSVELKAELDSVGKKAFIKRQRYESIQNNEDIMKDLANTIKNIHAKVQEYLKIMEIMQITPDSITKDEYITALGVLNSFRKAITNIRSYATQWQIDYVYRYIESNGSIHHDLSYVLDMIDKNRDKLEKLKDELSEYTALQKEASILQLRPDICTIDTCAFISSALAAKKKEPDKYIKTITEEISKTESDIATFKQRYSDTEGALRVFNQLNLVLKTVRANKVILAKLPGGSNFTNEKKLIDRILRGDTFNDIADLYKHVDQANILDEYTHECQILATLQAEYSDKKSQVDSMKNLEIEIAELEQEMAEISRTMKSMDDRKAAKTKEIAKLTKRRDNLEETIANLRKEADIANEIEETNNAIKVLNVNVKKIANEVENINRLNSQLATICSEILPLEQTCNSLSFSLSKLFEYKNELAVYNDKYQLVELIKKYSSPTKGGIQTVFMQLYMDKTLNMSNQLLQTMFDGDLELLPYIINENEFRIPVRNNITNLVTDDISNCSTSEKSMVAMIMSFVLAFQGSTMYNIIRLDEIDGGLDQSNRAMFPEILRNIMSILNIEQCLIISHSSESDLSDVDVISLTPVSHETLKGNVIFQL